MCWYNTHRHICRKRCPCPDGPHSLAKVMLSYFLLRGTSEAATPSFYENETIRSGQAVRSYHFDMMFETPSNEQWAISLGTIPRGHCVCECTDGSKFGSNAVACIYIYSSAFNPNLAIPQGELITSASSWVWQWWLIIICCRLKNYYNRMWLFSKYNSAKHCLITHNRHSNIRRPVKYIT